MPTTKCPSRSPWSIGIPAACGLLAGAMALGGNLTHHDHGLISFQRASAQPQPETNSTHQTVMSAKTAHDGSKTGKLVLIDIRHQDEWRQTGLPKEGKAITLHQGQKAFLAQIDKAVGADRSKPVALICATGSRSAYAQGWLNKHGYTQVYNVAEGMMGGAHGQGWIKLGLPTRPWTPRSVQTPTNN